MHDILCQLRLGKGMVLVRQPVNDLVACTTNLKLTSPAGLFARSMAACSKQDTRDAQVNFHPYLAIFPHFCMHALYCEFICWSGLYMDLELALLLITVFLTALTSLLYSELHYIVVIVQVYGHIQRLHHCLLHLTSEVQFLLDHLQQVEVHIYTLAMQLVLYLPFLL